MKKLLKRYSVPNQWDYYLLIMDNYDNENRAQAINMFRDMPKKNKITFIKTMVSGEELAGDIIFFLNLL